VMNLADTVAEEPALVQHKDLLPHFLKDAEKLPAMTLSAKLPAGFVPTSAVLHTPEQTDAVALAITVENGTAKIKVPAGIFSGYALIAVE